MVLDLAPAKAGVFIYFFKKVIIEKGERRHMFN